MNAESSMSSQSYWTTSCYTNANAVSMVNLLTTGLSDPVEPVFTQQQKGSLMQYPAQATQIGQQITQIILTTPDPPTLLARIAKALGEMFGVEICTIVAGVNSATMPQIAVWWAEDYLPCDRENQAQRLKQLALTGDLANPEPWEIADLQTSNTDSNVSGGWDVLPARAILRVHTRFQSSVNGAILLGRSQPYEWTTQEKELLALASESVAVAISQVHLTRQIHAASRYQTLLNQLSVAIRSDLDLNEILQMAITNTARVLQVERGLLLLLKDTNPVFKSQPSKQLPETEVIVACEWIAEAESQSVRGAGRVKTLLNHSFSLDTSSLCQQAFKNAPEPLVISKERDTPTPNASSENLSLFEQEMKSAGIVVPLIQPHTDSSPATVLGFLVFQDPRPRSWNRDELELVTWVSTQVSATLLQNQTLQQVQSLVEERTAQLQRSLQVQAKLYEKTCQQIDQLQQLNQLKEEFLSSMSHELRTPLTTMSLAIRMLRQANLPTERREKYLEILEQQCNQEIDLINDLLSLQRLESNQAYIQPQKIDLMSLIQELTESFEEKWADKRLTLRVECPERLMFNTDPDSLHRILMELLTNAGKYSNPDTTVHLQIAPQVQQSVNQVVITLSNQGPGISPTDLNHIFDKFRRGQGVTKKAVQGTGLGLALVKCLVQHLNGTIDVQCCPCENSKSSLISFTLTLPQFLQQQQRLDRELIP